MKVTAVLAGVALLMCACDRKPPAVETQPSVTSEQPASVAPAPEASPQVAATKEQIGSSVGVRVVAGALPVMNVTGAILHRQELPEKETFFDQHRCVVALLNGWTEAQLKSDLAKILIFRNLPDERGQPGSHAYRGKLLQFDEKSGIALFTYFQGFSAETDIGFRIDRETTGPLRAIALRYGNTDGTEEPQILPPGQTSRQSFPPITVDEGQMDITAKSAGKLVFPLGEPDQSGEAALITKGPASLVGFASKTGTNTADLVRVPPVQIALQLPTIVPTSATFTNHGGSIAQMSLHVERKNGAESLTRAWVRHAVVPPGAKVDLKSFSEPYTPIRVTQADHNFGGPIKADQTVTANLPSPQRLNEEITHLVQVAWALSNEEPNPSLHARPFLVTLANRAGGIIATTEGIAGPSAPSPEQDARTATFQMEAPVVRIFEIAEGKEVLMQLLGDPYWKRFSLEKKSWLPLPPINSSTVDLAGNRSSLIVLDRAAGEVKRYQLSDLTLAATAKLNLANEEIFTVRAGCLSDHAPIHVFCSSGPVSLDAETLQRIEDSDERHGRRMNSEGAAKYRATGDGITVASPEGSSFTFRGNILGLRSGYFDSEHSHSRGEVMVSAALQLADRKVSTCAVPGGAWKPIMHLPASQGATWMFAFPNAPVVAHLTAGNKQTIPPAPPQIELFSLWHPEPLAAVPVPELSSITGSHGDSSEAKHQVCVDLHSRRVGILSPDQKTWSVRDFEPPKDMGRPVLSNWPETTVKRGGDFRFVPLHAGEARYSAELLGAKEPTPVTIDANGISFRIAENELASLLVLNLTVGGKAGSTVASIPIHVGGVPLPFIWPDLNPGINPDDFGNGFKSLIVSKDRRIALKTDFYESPDRIQEILAPTSDILAFVTGASRVDLFSLSSRKIVGSITSTQTATYFAGCDALFEYDSNSRTLTRITVPDGQRRAHLTLPADVDLNAIALGSQRDHPVSLFLNKRQNEQSAQIGSWNFTTWQNSRALAVVNSETLQTGGLMQPIVWTDATGNEAAGMAINPGVSSQAPMKIAGSQNGSIIHLNNHFGVILPRFAIVAPYPDIGNRSGLYFPHRHAEGSTTGIVATAGGAVSRNGILEDNLGALGTPCGRYVLVKVNAGHGGVGSFEVRSIENRQPIFRLNRLAALHADHETGQYGDASGIQILRENGPAIIKSRGNKLLQFVDFDIPRLAVQAAPDSFHVISQPMPLVMEGGTYEYQVRVNNPGMVKGFRLRQPPPNTTISPSGLLRVAAPQNVRLTTRVPVSIEIETKAGSSVLHNFSIIALSKKLPTSPPPQSRPPATPPRRGNARTL